MEQLEMEYYDEDEEEVEALIVGDNSGRPVESRHQSPSRKKYRILLIAAVVILMSSMGFFLGRNSDDGNSVATTSTKAMDNLPSPGGNKPDHDAPGSAPTESSNTREAIVKQQIENFREGTGVILNFHITHHAGTTFCGQFSKYLRTPSFACLGPKKTESGEAGEDFTKENPWTKEETPGKIAIVKQYYDLIAWEWRQPPPPNRLPQIPDTDWENPNLVSVLVIREPISRLLAGDGYVRNTYPNVYSKNNAKKLNASLTNGTEEEWMNFAHDDKHCNNYALRILAGKDCCDFSNTDPIHLQRAKDMVSRFTFVLDIACLNDGMQTLADTLGIANMTIEEPPNKAVKHVHKSNEDRIPYPRVHEFLKESNKLDIELYEWSKSRALVDCAALEAAKESEGQE